MATIWIGSHEDVRYGGAAEAALSTKNDSEFAGQDGIVAVSESRWLEAQKYEHDAWAAWSAITDDRSLEHKKKFENYKNLKKALGEVIEFGCGPFGQSREILKGRTCTSLTLLDPLVEQYPKIHPACSYAGGKLMGRDDIKEVKLVASRAEDFSPSSQYDTAICINVLEHVQDAKKVLDAILASVKQGGLVIFADRSWDGWDPTSAFDVGHPIRVKRGLIDEFRSNFTLSFKHEAPGSVEGLEFTEHYFFGKKK